MEAITCMVDWDSCRAQPTCADEVVWDEVDEGSPDRSVFRKTVTLFKNVSSDRPSEAPLPPEGQVLRPEVSAGGLGRVAAGSNAGCRAPPFAA